MNKTSDVLYQTVIKFDFRSSEMPPLPNNGIWLQIDMLGVCRSLESTVTTTDTSIHLTVRRCNKVKPSMYSIFIPLS